MYLDIIEKGIKTTLKKARTESQQDIKRPPSEKKIVDGKKEENPRFGRGAKTTKTDRTKTNRTKPDSNKKDKTKTAAEKTDRFKSASGKPSFRTKPGRKGQGTKGFPKSTRSQ